MSGGPASDVILGGTSPAGGTEAARLPLARAMGSRILAGFALPLVSLPAFGMFLAALALVGDEPVASVFCATIAFGIGWLAWSIGRIAFHRGAWIEVGPESLTVHHPVVLRRDLVIPRDQVRAAAVSSLEDADWWLEDQFDLFREEEGLTVHAGREEPRC